MKWKAFTSVPLSAIRDGKSGNWRMKLESKSWITQEPNREVIDLSKVDGLWKDMLRDLNPYYRLVADEPDDLSLN